MAPGNLCNKLLHNWLVWPCQGEGPHVPSYIVPGGQVTC
jgi:hypothetical protein